MKFGKRLRDAIEDMLPEWKNQFLCYKELKKWLKRTIQSKASETGKHGEEDTGLSDEAKIFVTRVNEELQKFNDFFADKEEDFVIQLRRLVDAVDSLVSRASLDPSSVTAKPFQDELESLTRALVVFHGEMVLLENYSLINYLGLRKILKKHDKLVSGGAGGGGGAAAGWGEAANGGSQGGAVLSNGTGAGTWTLAVSSPARKHAIGAVAAAAVAGDKAEGAHKQNAGGKNTSSGGGQNNMDRNGNTCVCKHPSSHPLRVPYLAQILRQPFYTTDLLGQLVAAAEAQYRRLAQLQVLAASSGPASPQTALAAAHAASRGEAPASVPTGGKLSAMAKPSATANPSSTANPSTTAKAFTVSVRENGPATAAAREESPRTAHACPESAAAPCSVDPCTLGGQAASVEANEEDSAGVTVAGPGVEGLSVESVPTSPSEGRKGSSVGSVSASPFHQHCREHGLVSPVQVAVDGELGGIPGVEEVDPVPLDSEHVLRSTLEALRTLQMFRPKGVSGVGIAADAGRKQHRLLERQVSIDELEAAAARSLAYGQDDDDDEDEEDEGEGSGVDSEGEECRVVVGEDSAGLLAPKRRKVSV